MEVSVWYLSKGRRKCISDYECHGPNDPPKKSMAPSPTGMDGCFLGTECGELRESVTRTDAQGRFRNQTRWNQIWKNSSRMMVNRHACVLKHLLPDKKVIPVMEVYKCKLNKDGCIDKLKWWIIFRGGSIWSSRSLDKVPDEIVKKQIKLWKVDKDLHLQWKYPPIPMLFE